MKDHRDIFRPRNRKCSYLFILPERHEIRIVEVVHKMGGVPGRLITAQDVIRVDFLKKKKCDITGTLPTFGDATPKIAQHARASGTVLVVPTLRAAAASMTVSYLGIPRYSSQIYVLQYFAHSRF